MTKKFDVKDVIRKYAEIKSSSGGNNFVKLQSNVDNPVRMVLFLNEKNNSEELYVEYKQHWINKKSYICIGIDCPICKTKDFLESRDGEREFTSRMRAKRQFVFNVIHENEMKLLEIGTQCANSIFGIFADEDYGNVADLHTGRILKIKKTGSGLDTEYSVLPSPKIDRIKKLPGDTVDLNAWVKNKTNSKEQLIEIVEGSLNVNYYEEIEQSNKKVSNNAYDVDELNTLTKAELGAICRKNKWSYQKTATKKYLVDMILNDGLPF